MAGQPLQRQLAEAIELDGGDAAIFDRVAAGEATKAIAQSYGMGYEALRRWINKTDARRAEYEQAKTDSADALVEEAGEILDEARADSGPEIQKARSRADHRRWLATKRDRKQYGDDPKSQLNVHLDLGSLHLDALRQVGHMDQGKEIPEADYRVLPDGERDDDT